MEDFNNNDKKKIFTSKWTKWIAIVGLIYIAYFLAIMLLF